MDSPVVRLNGGLLVSDLLKTLQTVFEVTPDDENDDDSNKGTSAESCFNFETLKKVTNLDLIDLEDDEEGTPFDKYRRKMHNLRNDGKLMKYVVVEGRGSVLPDKSFVYIQYQAHLEYQELPFDSTLWQCDGNGDKPVGVNLSKGELLPGLYEGLLSMKKGEKAEFLVHPDLAYGLLGCPPRVPPEATVLFIVELISFMDCGDAYVTDCELSIEERSKFCNAYKIAKANSKIGNDLYNKKKYSAAVNKYKLVITMMHNARLADDKEEKERNNFLLKNYTNACLCYFKLTNWKKVCTMAKDATYVDNTGVQKIAKLQYVWGCAKMNLNDYGQAKRHLLSAKNLEPLDSAIGKALKQLEERKMADYMREKTWAKSAFSFPSKVKIEEIDEAEEEFRKQMEKQLKEFKENPHKDSLTLRDSFTTQEEKVFIQMARDMGLHSRVIDGNTRAVHLKKPDDM